CSLGLEHGYIAERLHTFKAAFGRQERVEFRGRHLVLVLSKNPAGFNETVRTAVDLAGGKNFIIGLNDRKADGTDVSWIWDVDFEQLKGRADLVIPAGVRAHDLAVRLKYADVKAEEPQTGAERDARRRHLLLRRRPGPRAGPHLRRPQGVQTGAAAKSRRTERRAGPRGVRRLPAPRPLLPDGGRPKIRWHRHDRRHNA